MGQVYRREALRLSAAAMAWLQAQPWPGNVRQLRQSVERAVLVTDERRARSRRLQARLRTMEPQEAPPRYAAAGRQHDDGRDREGDDREVAEHHTGNISRVAESLGLSRAALYRRFEKYEIHV